MLLASVKLNHFSFIKTETQNEAIIIMNFDMPNNTWKKYVKHKLLYIQGEVTKTKIQFLW